MMPSMTQSLDNTLTLALEGEVVLDAFAAATTAFQRLVAALTEELAAGGAVRWIIEDLAAGSAVTTARGIAERDEARVGIVAVTHAYLEVGRALEGHRPIPYSQRVDREARAIASVLARVEAIRFETAVDEAVLSNGSVEGVRQTAFPLGEAPPRRRALGAVRGRIQTLSSRGGLRFTLYDALNNRAVSCYLAEGQEELMRHAWDQAAVVEGLVTRDAHGRPLSVRQVSAVRVLEEARPDAYLRAKGAITPAPDAPRPEVVIRRLRDAG